MTGIGKKPELVDGRVEPLQYVCITGSFVEGVAAVQFVTRFRELAQSASGLADQ